MLRKAEDLVVGGMGNPAPDFRTVCPSVLRAAARVIVQRLRPLARSAYRHAQSAKDLLVALASIGRNPPRMNESVNRLECRYGRSRLRSYPPVVGFALSNYCNQRCRFCSLDTKQVTRRVLLPAEVFERMRWLRYVREIWLSGAAGDSLVHPEFARIARTVRRLAPKSRLMLCTNGLGLCGENLDAVDCLDYINISANAASESTYGILIKGGNFRRLAANLEALSARKKPSLAVHLSMVLTRSATADVRPMIDMASRLQFEAVEVYQYFPIPPVDGALPLSESLNDDPDAWAAVRQLAGYAREKNVGYIVAGEQLAPCRSFNTVVKYPGAGGCTSPWSNAHISIGPDGGMAFSICCSGVSMNLAVEDSAFADFKKIWNCRRMQEIRRTVNACDDRQNNMCWLCRRFQRADYGSKRELRELAERKRPSIRFTAADDPIAFPLTRVV